jgi:hypothetical protein
MNARSKVEEAARSRLEIGEPLLASGFAWIAFPRPKVSLLFLARKPHLVGLTDRRVMIWSRPHKGGPPADESLVLDAMLTDLTFEGERTRSPMLQVRIATNADRRLVLEFRPRGRRLGERLARALRGETEPTNTPEVEASA